jgi:FolB domain-containing protein
VADSLTIKGLELFVCMGCTAQERAFPQKLLADVEMELPLKNAGASDQMKDTVDYADIALRIKEEIEPKVYNLAEALAEDVAALVRKRYKVKKVRVGVTKRILPGIDGFIVRIERP